MTKGNYKIDVSQLNTAERRALQEELFKMGYQWANGISHTTNLDKEYLCLFEDGAITYCDKNYFPRSTHRPITVSDILTQPIQTITLRDLFAGLAMVQLMQVHETEETVGRAYLYADAMLKERNNHV